MASLRQGKRVYCIFEVNVDGLLVYLERAHEDL
jgi:hypothetical protein